MSVLATSFFTFETMQRKETCSIVVFYYWTAECESEGHHQIRQKKVNLIELIDIFLEMAILINLLYSVTHHNYLNAVLKQLKHSRQVVTQHLE